MFKTTPNERMNRRNVVVAVFTGDCNDADYVTNEQVIPCDDRGLNTLMDEDEDHMSWYNILKVANSISTIDEVEDECLRDTISELYPCNINDGMEISPCGVEVTYYNWCGIAFKVTF